MADTNLLPGWYRCPKCQGRGSYQLIVTVPGHDGKLTKQFSPFGHICSLCHGGTIVAAETFDRYWESREYD